MKSYMHKAIMFSSLALILGACQTVPYQTKVDNFEAPIRAKYVGKSVDNVVLDMGPPNSNYTLSDGREVLQYSKKRMDRTSMGGTIAIGTGFGGYHNRGSVVMAWPFFSPFYDNSYNERELVCVKRFLVDKDKKVTDFRWEGNACF
jgi:hypothetical protein